MTKLWVHGPAKFNAFRVLCLGVSIYAGYKVIGYYCRREFMRRVRVRNDLVRLDVATIKDMVDVDILTIDGQKLRFEDLSGEYLCIFNGAFKDFARIHRVLLETQYGADLNFLYVTDQERLNRLSKDAIRVPLPKS